MHRLNAIGLFFGLALLGCQSEKTKSSMAAAGEQDKSIFFISPRPMVLPENNSAANWCLMDWSKSLPVNQLEGQPNTYFLALHNQACRISIRFGMLAAGMMLKRTPEGRIEVFTGNNYPRCLSKPEYFKVLAAENRFTYDNGKGIKVNVSVRNEENQSIVFLQFPPEYQYGLIVMECLDCK